MSIVAFAGDAKITLNDNGSITITVPGENWGSARGPEPDQSVTIAKPNELVRGIQYVLSERSSQW